MKTNQILVALLALAMGFGASAQCGRDLQDDEMHGAVKRVDAVM